MGEFLKRIYENRKKYFDQIDDYLEKIKEIVGKECTDAEIYLFGSVIEGDYSVGLSDIDIAIVSDRFNDRDLKLNIFGILTRIFFDSPFEFHVLTKEQWRALKRFVRDYRKSF